jgi:hypothetical protein
LSGHAGPSCNDCNEVVPRLARVAKNALLNGDFPRAIAILDRLSFPRAVSPPDGEAGGRIGTTGHGARDPGISHLGEFWQDRRDMLKHDRWGRLRAEGPRRGPRSQARGDGPMERRILGRRARSCRRWIGKSASSGQQIPPGLCASARLAHVRILNVTRIAPNDLSAFIQSCRSPARGTNGT